MDAHFPGGQALLDALDGPGAWIVATAKRFIRAGGSEFYPKAVRRL